VLEIHIDRDVYDAVTPRGTRVRAQKETLRKDLQEVGNCTENLNYTSPDINNVKFKACWAFQEDYRNDNGLYETQGLFPYLQTARSKDSEQRLSRSESRSIRDEVLKSSDAIIDGLQQENPLHDQVIDILQRNITAMRLH